MKEDGQVYFDEEEYLKADEVRRPREEWTDMRRAIAERVTGKSL